MVNTRRSDSSGGSSEISPNESPPSPSPVKTDPRPGRSGPRLPESPLASVGVPSKTSSSKNVPHSTRRTTSVSASSSPAPLQIPPPVASRQPSPRPHRKAEPSQYVRPATAKPIRGTPTSTTPKVVDPSGQNVMEVVVSGSGKKKPPSSNPTPADFKRYDPSNPKNKDRLEIEGIITRHGTEPNSLLPHEIDRLKKPIAEWSYVPRAPQFSKAGDPSRLKTINEKRKEILLQYGKTVRTHTPQPLQRELQGNPSLAKWKETKVDLENPKSSPLITRRRHLSPIKPPSPNTPLKSNTSTTFYTKLSTPTGTTGGSKGKTPKQGNDHGSALAGGSGIVPSTRRHVGIQEGGLSNEDTLLQNAKIRPPYQDPKVKCETRDALKFFRLVKQFVQQTDGNWLICIAQDSQPREISTIIPTAQTNEIIQINAEMNANKINIANAFLLDAVSCAWIDTCLESFESATMSRDNNGDVVAGGKLIDVRFIMIQILPHFMDKMVNGIFLPPLNLGRSTSKRMAKQHDRSVRVLQSMIPQKLRSLYENIIGKLWNDVWRVCEGRRITYGDSLGFLPSKKLSSNIFEALLVKFFREQPLPAANRILLILWSEIQALLETHPELDKVETKQSPLLSSLQARITQGASKLDFIYVPMVMINNDSNVQHGILEIIPSVQRMDMFLPEQPTTSLGDWAKNNTDKSTLGITIEYIKKLMEKMYNQKGQWCYHQADVNDVPLSFENTFPWNSFFLQSEIITKSTSISLSPIVCLMWMENKIMRENWIERKFVKDKELLDGDVRLEYFEMLASSTH